MGPLVTLDAAVFRFINLTLSNPIFDWLMPFFSSNAFFFPVALTLVALVAWKGGTRARLCVVLLILTVVLGDNWVCNTIKKAVARPRPFIVLKDARIRPPPDPAKEENEASVPAFKERENMNQLVAKGSYRSMPSGHSANWFAATMIAFIYYRRSVRFMLPLAITVAFSRVYNGVHYPSDVLAGAILGAGYAAGGIWILDWAWQWLGKFWFPIWWKQLPSIVNPIVAADVRRRASQATEEVRLLTSAATPTEIAQPAAGDAHWLRLGDLLILVLLLTRIGYIASDTIELSPDEAYHWLWSKHPALSYFDEPPLIAYVQWASTKLWGNTELGVRFFSPVLAAMMSFFLMRFLARETNARLGLLLILILQAIPLLALGSTLLTVDSLLAFFWTMAIIAGWRAVQNETAGNAASQETRAPERDWLWVGSWMGLAFLSKRNAPVLLICWPVFFALWKPSRMILRRSGFYCAMLVSLLLFLPVPVGNVQHGWAMFGLAANGSGPDQLWHPTFRQLGDFLGLQAVLLNPVFFLGAVWAATTFWRREKNNPRLIYFFSMGVPVFLVYLLLSLQGGMPPTWIAPAILPLLCLMMIFWENRAGEHLRWLKPTLTIGLIGGLFVVVLLHETRLIHKITGISLPGDKDPLRRVRAWTESAQAVNQARLELAKEGPPVFIIAENYRVASELSFYLPEAKAGVPANPLVYCRRQTQPMNQFYFWKGYEGRKGQSAIYVEEADHPNSPSPALRTQFQSVTFLGSREVKYRGRVFHRLQLFACRNLR